MSFRKKKNICKTLNCTCFPAHLIRRRKSSRLCATLPIPYSTPRPTVHPALRYTPPYSTLCQKCWVGGVGVQVKCPVVYQYPKWVQGHRFKSLFATLDLIVLISSFNLCSVSSPLHSSLFSSSTCRNCLLLSSALKAK